MRRVSIGGLAQAAGVLTMLFSLLTLLQSDFHGLQLFTHFRLQYFIVAALLVVAFVLLRDRRYAVLMFATAFINGAHVLPWYFDEPYSAGGRELTLLQANGLSTNTEHEGLFALLESEKPDIVVLQEVSPAWAQELERLKSAYPHRVVEEREGNFGIALLSKYPLVATAVVASEPLEFPTVVATLDVSGRRLQLIGTHPMIPLGSRNYAHRNSQLESVANLLRRSA